jgi:hypothetical protein
METKLNDNEVREVAQMQMKIDVYEAFISTINCMLRTNRADMNYILFDGTPLTKEMNSIWRKVRGYIKESKGK